MMVLRGGEETPEVRGEETEGLSTAAVVSGGVRTGGSEEGPEEGRLVRGAEEPVVDGGGLEA